MEDRGGINEKSESALYKVDGVIELKETKLGLVELKAKHTLKEGEILKFRIVFIRRL